MWSTAICMYDGSVISSAWIVLVIDDCWHQWMVEDLVVADVFIQG